MARGRIRQLQSAENSAPKQTLSCSLEEITVTRPFPGVDPYLELPPFWGDFSPSFLSAIQNQLLGQLLPDHDVRMIDGVNHSDEKERHLHIVHRASQRVITVLELLSPSNKSPGQDGLGRYLDKRNEFLSSGCHLIEMDLLRGGQRLPMAEPLPPGDYYALIGRVGRKPRCQVIGWSLRAKLPPIPIPLLPADPEVTLNLDAAFGLAYESSFYSRRLPYDEPLV